MRTRLALGSLVASLAVSVGLIAGACTGSTTPASPTSPPTAASAPPASSPASQPGPSPTAISPAASPVAASPAAAASPAPSPVAAASPAAASSSPAAAAKPGGGQGVRLTLAADGNEARFRAREQLAGQSLPNEAVGATQGVEGSILLGPNGALVPAESKITVDLTTLRSNESRRDNWIQRNTLQTARFPTAELVPREASGLPSPLPASGEATFRLGGDLAVHGVTRPTIWEMTARFAGQEVTGTGSTRVKMTDFGMTPPRVGPVLSIEDDLTLEVDFRATREPAPSAG